MLFRNVRHRRPDAQISEVGLTLDQGFGLDFTNVQTGTGMQNEIFLMAKILSNIHFMIVSLVICA